MEKTIVIPAFLSLALLLAPTPRASAAPRAAGWYCLMGVLTSSGQTVESCERTQAACETDRKRNLEQHAGDWQLEPKPCFASKKAAWFSMRHKQSKKVEVLAVPELDACKFLRAAILAEEGDGVDRVTECKLGE